MHGMLGYLERIFVVTTTVFTVLATAAFADDRPAEQTIQEEVWAIPVTLPTIAYVVRPVGKGPYHVVAPTGSGYGAAALDEPERGHYSLFFSKVGHCDNPNFHDAGRLVALMDRW